MTERARDSTPAPRILLPEAPALVAWAGRAVLITVDGEVLDLPTAAAVAQLRRLPPPLLVHAPATLRRLGLRGLPCLDLLELFAFVLPARTAAPTPRGLALALEVPPPGQGLAAAAAALPELAQALLARLAAARELPLNREAAALALRMGRAGWSWADIVAAALGGPPPAAGGEPLRVWRGLPEWEEVAPPPPPACHPVPPADARLRLAAMLGEAAEQRPGQSDYAAAAAAAFAPRETSGDPHFVLAEAGTGTGKTLGYIAPASLWAERNRGAVWISTFTRHLQRQVEAELARLHPDPAERRRRVVVRKGRENYLCLLNFEDAVSAAALSAPASAVPLGLVVRWMLATSDGDIQGGDLPGWFAELFGSAFLRDIADRRGECLHGGCSHWRKCFVEHVARRAREAELVVANHALVMIQAAHGGIDDTQVPSRYVFDEGHHVFDAADSAFAVVLSGLETALLRRWLLGSEGAASRMRGLQWRLDGLVASRPALNAPLAEVLRLARVLPGADFRSRLAVAGTDEAELLRNPTERLLAVMRRQVLARTSGGEEADARVLECDVAPALADLLAAAGQAGAAYARLQAAIASLVAALEAWSDEVEAAKDQPVHPEEEAGPLRADAAFLSRIDGTVRSLRRRGLDRLTAWQQMLRGLAAGPPAPGTRVQQVMFLRLERRDGHDADVGLHRHWLDPTEPLALSLAGPAQGLLVTSATLRDAGTGDPESEWATAEARVGAIHLPSPAIRVAVASPFDYASQTRAYVIDDVDARDTAVLAAAYQRLFLAAGGGGLGLFTAISRLRAVHERIAPALEQAGIPLLAQHVEPMDPATLVDIFRTEEKSCLLGTDAMRDGVDVPGRALRLVVFERVPWPRPDILHRERRVHLSGGDPRGYDDRIVRLRLRQAFGRLIRTATDRGVFVLLDRRTPTRLLSAFPPQSPVRRVGLAEAVAETRTFLSMEGQGPPLVPFLK
jgi:ATP-dependent DNA helicase DinG